MWFATANAMSFLNEALNLPASGHEQDWEIELSKPDRINDFIAFYQSCELSEDTKQALMALILASFEDALWQSKFDGDLWDKNSAIILSEFALFKEILDVWAVEDGEEGFAISPHVQKLISQENT